ncbi:MAG TPA: hypothetical protein VF546_17355 [Pyrinomonadaceae bacterium]|jgi:tetratricopeptide (TPR) repeat protein
MSAQITSVKVAALWRRVLLLVPVAAACAGAWYVGRWSLGNTMAEWLPDAGAARVAARLAPDDPQAHFTLARLAERSFEPEQLAAAVAEYEQAAAGAPNDYRLWFELGRARGLAGDDAGGERALRRAVELAPNYPAPHWYLGNLLLRTGRDQEAFAELRQAAAADPEKYRAQVFEIAWRAAGGRTADLLALVGDTPDARAALIEFLLNRQTGDAAARAAARAEAARIWTGLDAAARRAHQETGTKLRDAFLAAKQYHAALAVERQLSGSAATTSDAATNSVATDGATRPALPAEDQLLNGGFEQPVGPPGKTWYDWQVAQVAQAEVKLDPSVRRGGARSLRLVFNATGALDFQHVSQLVVVAPQTRYRLSYFVRTEELQSASTLVTEVSAAAAGARRLAAAPPLAQGSSDWQQTALDFTTGASDEAVVVRLVRAPCAQALCPLSGKVWYDDFNLERLGGGPANGGRARADAADARAR